MRAQFIPVQGGSPLEITKDITLVGRKEECDLRLDHKSVSKLHCVVVKTDGLLLLRDLGSTNGTRVNGQRIRRAALLPNDQVAIAGFGFKVYLGPSEPPVSPLEGTQQLNANDLDRLKERLDDADPAASDPEGQNIPLRVNALPDVYVDAAVKAATHE